MTIVPQDTYFVSFELPLGNVQTVETKKLLGGKCWSGNYMTNWWNNNRQRNAVPVGGNLLGTAYRNFLQYNKLEASIGEELVTIYKWLKANPDLAPEPAYKMADEIKKKILNGSLMPELVEQMNKFMTETFVKHIQSKINLFNQIYNQSIHIDNSVLVKYAKSALTQDISFKSELDSALILEIGENFSLLKEFIAPLITEYAVIIRSSFTQLEDKDDDVESSGDSEGAGLFESLPATFWNWKTVLKEFWAEVFDGPRAISSTYRYWAKDKSTPLLVGDMPAMIVVKDQTENGYSCVTYSGHSVTQVTVASGFDSVVKGDNQTINFFFSNDSLVAGNKNLTTSIRYRDSYQKLDCFPDMTSQIRELYETALFCYQQSLDLGYATDQESGNAYPGNLSTISQYQVRKWHGGEQPSSINVSELTTKPTTKPIGIGSTNSSMICKGRALFVSEASELPRDMSGLIIVAPNAGTEYRRVVLAWGTPQEAAGFLAKTGSVTAHVSAVLAGKMLCGVSTQFTEEIQDGDFITCVSVGGKIYVYRENMPFQTKQISFDSVSRTKIKTGLVLTDFGWTDKDALLPNVSKVSLLRWEMMENGAIVNGLAVLPMPCYLYYSTMPNQIKQQIDFQRGELKPVEFYISIMSDVIGGVLNSFAGRQVNLRLPDYRVPVEANFYLPSSVFKNPDNPDASLSGARLLSQSGDLGRNMLTVCGDVLSELISKRSYRNLAVMLPNVCFPELDAKPVVNYLRSRGVNPNNTIFVCMDEVPELSQTDINGDAIHYLALADMGFTELSEGTNDQGTAMCKIARDQTPIYHVTLASSPTTRARYMRKVENAAKVGLTIGSCGYASPDLLSIFIDAGFESVGLPVGSAYFEAKNVIAELESQN